MFREKEHKYFTPLDKRGGGRVIQVSSEPVVEAVYSKEEDRTPYAIVWAGQGSQKVGMGKGMRGKYVTDIYREAQEVFGFPVRHVSLYGPEEILKFTIITQPSIVTHNVARLEQAKLEHPEYFARQPRFSAGLSLGEYSALLSSGVFTRRDAFKLIRARSAAMQYASEYNPGGNVVLMTPGRISEDEDPKRYEQAFNEATDELSKVPGLTVGIYYGRHMRVYAGAHDKLAVLKGISKRVGEGKYLATSDVQASGAFHSDAMKIGLPLFKKRLKETPMERAQTDVIANTTAAPIRDPKDVAEELVDQLLKPVQWEKTQEVIFDRAQGHIEMGESKALTNSMRRIIPRAAAIVGLTLASGLAAATVLKWDAKEDQKK